MLTVLLPALAHADTPADPTAVAAQLAELARVDQELRNGLPSPDDAEAWAAAVAEVARVDAEHTAILRQLVEQHGWITISAFGAQASRDAWLLVQHADAAPEFQREMLQLMTPLVPAGEVVPADYAYLWDRVAVAAGTPQRYGTQGSCEGEVWTPAALEDPAGVDALRAEVGLDALTAYAERTASLCRSEPIDEEPGQLDPCEGLDVAAERAAGFSPTRPIIVDSPVGPLPLYLTTEAEFEDILSSCEAPTGE